MAGSDLPTSPRLRRAGSELRPGFLLRQGFVLRQGFRPSPRLRRTGRRDTSSRHAERTVSIGRAECSTPPQNRSPRRCDPTSGNQGESSNHLLIKVFYAQFLERTCCEISRKSKERRGITIVARDELLERIPKESPSRRCGIRSDLRLGQYRAHRWCESYRQMSRRDCTIVAWHEVPGTAYPKRAVP